MADETYTPPGLWLRIKRIFLTVFFRYAFRLLFKVRISGLENVPGSGPYLIAHNHVSIIEPPLVISNWPVQPEAIGAAELWGRTGQNFLVSQYGTIPVHRGEYDRAMLTRLINVLKAGRPLILAPEGSRTHVPGLQRAQPGIGYIVDQAAVKVVPVAVIGSTDDALKAVVKFKRPALEMIVGEPFEVPKIESRGAERRMARQRNADLVMLKIAEMLPPEYRGIYADFNPDSSETS